MLISTHPQAQAEGNHLDANEAKSQIEGSLNNAQALSEVAKNQQTDPLEVLDNLKNFLEQIEQQDENKAAAFKQALMILSAPNSIALSSQQDVHLSADGQISQSAGESINLSTQQSLIAHASQKLSLFAAQEGARLYAGKGKVEIQAQGDGADLIARKGVQIISTEDIIDFKSAKEIILTAGGSQLRITGSGIFPTTGGKFEVKAGQHLFKGGDKVKTVLPNLSNLSMNKENYSFTNRIDAFDIFEDYDFSKIKYRAFLPQQESYKTGTLDQYGRTERFTSINNKKEQIQVVIDDPFYEWSITSDEDLENDADKEA